MVSRPKATPTPHRDADRAVRIGPPVVPLGKGDGVKSRDVGTASTNEQVFSWGTHRAGEKSGRYMRLSNGSAIGSGNGRRGGAPSNRKMGDR